MLTKGAKLLLLAAFTIVLEASRIAERRRNSGSFYGELQMHLLARHTGLQSTGCRHGE
jgi:hypothetical protein